MRIGVPRETKTAEARVALVPAAAGDLVNAGHEVWIEHDAGTGETQKRTQDESGVGWVGYVNHVHVVGHHQEEGDEDLPEEGVRVLEQVLPRTSRLDQTGGGG